MARLWLKVIAGHKTVMQQTEPCLPGYEKDALTEICKQLDLPCPIWLNKHENEFSSFRRTVFTKEHFMEDTSFDKLEIEYLDDTDKKRRSSDPRNQF